MRMYRHTQPRTNKQRESPPCAFANRYVRAEPLETAALVATRQMLSSEHVIQLAREELTRLRQNAGTEHHATALREAETALSLSVRAASEANLRAARATTDVERQIHDATMRELLLESETLTVRVHALRSDAERIAAAEKRLPAMEARLGDLRTAFDSRSMEEQKGVVAAVVESMRVDFNANAVEVRVRTV
jgi:hypothetical protein